MLCSAAIRISIPVGSAVCGGSYGGFRTNWITGHTDRFAAACSQRSFANMINFEYLSDIGLTNIRSEHMGSTEEDLERLWNESPLKHAPACRTPTLFIHSDQDFRCPMPDALEMFSCLKRAGCPPGSVCSMGRTMSSPAVAGRITGLLVWRKSSPGLKPTSNKLYKKSGKAAG